MSSSKALQIALIQEEIKICLYAKILNLERILNFCKIFIHLNSNNFVIFCKNDNDFREKVKKYKLCAKIISLFIIESNHFAYTLSDDLSHITLNRGPIKSIQSIVIPFDFGCDCNHTLTDVTIGNLYDYIIEPGFFPPSIKSINFGRYDRKINPEIFPENMESLTLGTFYDKPIDENFFPKKLKKINFNLHFNQSVSAHMFPHTITEIIFGNVFNQPLDFIFHEGLTHITLGNRFNRDLYLPDSMETITIPSHYNKKIICSNSNLNKIKTTYIWENMNDDYFTILANKNNY